MEFNISYIPDYATITKVSLSWDGWDYYVSPVSVWTVKIYSLENQPSAQPDNATGNQVLWDDCEDGTMYLNSWANRVFGKTGAKTANHTSSDPRLVWDTTPVANLQSALVDDWFGFGFICFDEKWSKCYSSESSIANPKPTLWVEWEANPPTISNPSPTNGSYDIDLEPTTCVDVTTPTGTPLNITWKWYNGSGWEIYGTNTSVANGTYCQDFTNASGACRVYYWWVHAEEDGGDHNFTNSYFEFSTTCLGPPDNLSCAIISPGLINITWDKFYNATGEMYTVIRYSSQGIPPLFNEGTLAYNGTGNYTNIYIGEGTCAAISAWSQFNDSGNWSISNRATKICCSGGGNYTICFRYENSTLVDGYNNPINFSKYPHSAHELTIHFLDLTNQTYYLGADWYNDSWGNWTVNSKRTCLNLSVDRDVLFFSFHWNWSVNITANANTTCSYTRYLTPNAGKYTYSNKTITFYIEPSLHVLGQPYWYWDNGSTIGTETSFYNTIVPYHYYIEDYSGLFSTAPANDAYASIFIYNRTGVKLIIDEQYIDTSKSIYPHLIFQKPYYIGFHSSLGHRWNIGQVPNKDVSILTETIEIPLLTNETKAVSAIFNFSCKFTDSGIKVYYSDKDYQTNYVRCVIRDENHVLVYSKNVSNNEYVFKYVAADTTKYYFIKLTISHPELKQYYTNSSITIPFTAAYGMSPYTTAESFNDVFENALGKSLIYNPTNGNSMTWTNIFVIIGMIIMTIGVGHLHYSAGFISGGLTGLILYVGISGLSIAVASIVALLLFFGIFGMMVGGIKR